MMEQTKKEWEKIYTDLPDKATRGRAGMSDNLDALVARLLALVEKRKDPAFVELVKVLRQECKHLNSGWRDSAGFRAICPECGVEWEPTPDNLTPPLGYVPRPWSSLCAEAPGTLAGSIAQWTGGCCDREPWATLHWAILALFGIPGVDEETVKLVIKFLEHKEGGHTR